MSYLLIGLANTELSASERQWLRREEVGGVVLFKRNVADIPQLQHLIASIREIDADAILAIDQEGGRVQRIGAPLTALPALSTLGQYYRTNVEEGLTLTFNHAWLMASEIRSLGIDLSFAPVLDLDRGSEVIGDRSFGSEVDLVCTLSAIYMQGMHKAGMAATAKHFPGHGSVTADTHHAVAVDPRTWDDIAISDLIPFAKLVDAGLDAVMLAHVVYPKVCAHAVGYSQVWIDDILRQRMGFRGVIFGDDIGMRAAAEIGDLTTRVRTHLQAGCDFILVCHPKDTAETMAGRLPTPSEDRRAMLRITPHSLDWSILRDSDARRAARIDLQRIARHPCKK